MKKVILFAFVSLFALAFVGCNDLTSSTTTQAQTTAGETTTAAETTTTAAETTTQGMTTTQEQTTTQAVTTTAGDTTPPVIAGADDVTIYLNSTFDPLAGVTATDDVDGDISGSIEVVGTVDTASTGTYYLLYKVEDAAGNRTQEARYVTVEIDPTNIGDEMVQNGDFSLGDGIWNLTNFEGAAADFSVVDGVGVVAITSPSWGIAAPRLESNTMTMENGVTYQVTFKAKADAVRAIGVQVGELLPSAPWFVDFMPGNLQEFDLTTDWQTFSFKVTMNEATTDNAQILFIMGTLEGTVGTANLATNVYFDDVMVEESTPDPDTTEPTINGIEDVTIELGATFDPLAGVSAIDIVDGAITLDASNVTGTVDTATEGDYTLTYTVTDAAGNTATETRIVTVVALVFNPTTEIVDGTFDTTTTIVAEVQDASYNDITDPEIWYSWYADWDGAAATYTVTAGVLSIDVTNVGGEVWSHQFKQRGITLVQGETYKLSFDASSTVDRDIFVEMISDVYRQTFSLTATETTYELIFTYDGETTTDGKVNFMFGNINSATASVITLDNVVLSQLDQDDTVTNGDFSAIGWDVWSQAGDTTLEIVNNELQVNVPTIGANFWESQLFQDGITLVPGTTYTITFDAMASVARDISLVMISDVEDRETFNLTTSMATYTMTFTYSGTATSGKLDFEFGNISGASVAALITLDNISISDGTNPVDVVNGTFDQVIGWGQWSQAGDTTISVVNEELVINVPTPGGNFWESQLFQENVTLVPDAIYTISFQAKADVARDFSFVLIAGGKEYRETFNLTTEMQTFSFSFLYDADATSGKLDWEFGNISDASVAAVVTMDNVFFYRTFNPMEMAPKVMGAEDVTVAVDATFDPLAGVTVYDWIDGAITIDASNVTGTVDTATEGDYVLTYTVTDSAGNETVVTRTVTVGEVTETINWTAYGMTGTDVTGGVSVDYVATAGNWYDNNFQVVVPTFDGTVEAIDFTFTGEAGQEYLIKIEGPDGNTEIVFTATGSEEIVTLDLSGLTEAQRNTFNLIIVFSHINSQVGTFVYGGYEYVIPSFTAYGMTATELVDGSISVDYVATAGNWYDNNLQVEVAAFDGMYEEIEFTFTGVAGQEYLIKIEGPDGNAETTFTATGSEEIVTLDLSGLTEAQRNTLNLVIVFSHINTQVGTFVYSGFDYVIPEWIGYGMDVVITETETTVTYTATAGNWWDNNVQSMIEDFDGTETGIVFTFTGEVGQTYLFKIEGGGQALQVEATATGASQTVTLDLSGLTEAQRDALNLIIIFSNDATQAGTFVIEGWQYISQTS